MEKDSLLVLSGGMDSVTMLYKYIDRIALAVTFDYGSNHNAREAACAADICRRLGVEHLLIPLGFLGQYYKSALLSGADAIPDGSYAIDNIKLTVVPFRNGVMLAVACGLAESRGLKRVMLANHGGDHTVYPDCRPEFISAMSQAMETGTDTHVGIWAPFTSLTKGQIAAIGKELGIDYSLTYSCYKGGKVHCGTCATCIERREALLYAGIFDNTVYEKDMQ